MKIDLSGKRAVVCGSTQGIGRASARLLAEAGASVTLVARNEQALSVLAHELPRSRRQNHDFLVADFADPATLKEVLKRYTSGLKDMHILVNNTGGPAPGTALEAGTESFIQAFQEHVVCNQLLVQSLVPFMKKARYGRIINIISTSVKAPIAGLGVSNTIRGAVANWAKTLSRELGPSGITVNNVLPGLTLTGRLQSLIETRARQAGITADEQAELMKQTIPLLRFAAPEEVAAAVAFLASPQAAYINGINLPVDGGSTPSL